MYLRVLLRVAVFFYKKKQKKKTNQFMINLSEKNIRKENRKVPKNDLKECKFTPYHVCKFDYKVCKCLIISFSIRPF